MSRIKRLSLLLCISVLILAGCKDNSKNENVADNSKSAKTEKEIVGYAAIHLEDGRTIELKPSSISGSAGDPTRLTANMRDNGIIVMLRLTSMEKPIKEKEYDN